VSNHLACLRWCGVVDGRREGRTVRYRIADTRVSELLALGRALLGGGVAVAVVAAVAALALWSLRRRRAGAGPS